MNPQELERLLRSELTRRESAPVELWSGIRQAMSRERPGPRLWISRRWLPWAVAVPLLATLIFGAVSVVQSISRNRVEAALQAYVSRVPDTAPTTITAAGLPVTAERTAMIAGQPVTQLVFYPEGNRTPESGVSLFIFNSRFRLPAGRSGSMQMVPFQCSKQVCLAACRRCTEQAIKTVVASFASAPLSQQ